MPYRATLYTESKQAFTKIKYSWVLLFLFFLGNGSHPLSAAEKKEVVLLIGPEETDSNTEGKKTFAALLTGKEITYDRDNGYALKEKVENGLFVNEKEGITLLDAEDLPWQERGFDQEGFKNLQNLLGGKKYKVKGILLCLNDYLFANIRGVDTNDFMPYYKHFTKLFTKETIEEIAPYVKIVVNGNFKRPLYRIKTLLNQKELDEESEKFISLFKHFIQKNKDDDGYVYLQDKMLVGKMFSRKKIKTGKKLPKNESSDSESEDEVIYKIEHKEEFIQHAKKTIKEDFPNEPMSDKLIESIVKAKAIEKPKKPKKASPKPIKKEISKAEPKKNSEPMKLAPLPPDRKYLFIGTTRSSNDRFFSVLSGYGEEIDNLRTKGWSSFLVKDKRLEIIAMEGFYQDSSFVAAMQEKTERCKSLLKDEVAHIKGIFLTLDNEKLKDYLKEPDKGALTLFNIFKNFTKLFSKEELQRMTPYIKILVRGWGTSIPRRFFSFKTKFLKPIFNMENQADEPEIEKVKILFEKFYKRDNLEARKDYHYSYICKWGGSDTEEKNETKAFWSAIDRNPFPDKPIKEVLNPNSPLLEDEGGKSWKGVLVVVLIVVVSMGALIKYKDVQKSKKKQSKEVKKEKVKLKKELKKDLKEKEEKTKDDNPVKKKSKTRQKKAKRNKK